eukprot:446218_1
MLYTKLTSVALAVYAYLSSPIHGGTYYLTQITSPFTCPPSEPCNIHCNVPEHNQIYEYNCGNSTNCLFHCEEKKCANGAAIYGANSTNLNVTLDAKAQQCFKNAHVVTPSHGNAYFHNGNVASKGYRGMKVYAGINAQNIIINCDGTSAIDECKEMEVHASTAQFLQINIGDQTNNTYESGIIECPTNSHYKGPHLAPCIIDATHGEMRSITITAPQGIPKGVWITGCGACDNTTQVICDTIDAVNGDSKSGVSTWPFDTNSDCWWNSTNHSTLNPTNNPTSVPTNNPITSNPSQNTLNPTHNPTLNPTQSTSTPSDNPTNTPTLSTTYDILYHTSEATFDHEPSKWDHLTWWWVIGILIVILFIAFIVFVICFLVKSIREDENEQKQRKKSSTHTIVHPMDMKRDDHEEPELDKAVYSLELGDVGDAFGLKHEAKADTSEQPVPIHIPESIVTGVESEDDNATPLIQETTATDRTRDSNLLGHGLDTPENTVLSPFSPVSPLSPVQDGTESDANHNRFKIRKHRASS